MRIFRRCGAFIVHGVDEGRGGAVTATTNLRADLRWDESSCAWDREARSSARINVRLGQLYAIPILRA